MGSIFTADWLRAALPAYEVGPVLGRGGFSVVVTARHRQLDRQVAIKAINAGMSLSSDFANEARILAALDHPHVVEVYDYVETDDGVAIVMELLSGGTLGQILRLGTPRVETACALGLALAGALDAAHGAKVLHRDVKPENILFTSSRMPKMTDFGIARIFGEALTGASTLVGTPRYMAPEQWLGRPLGVPTDLYALGLVMFELLVGAPAFSASGVAELGRLHLDSIPILPDSVPPRIRDAVRHTLAKDPAERPQSAEAFAVELARAAAAELTRNWLTLAAVPLFLSDHIRDAASLASAPRVAAGAGNPFTRIRRLGRGTGRIADDLAPTIPAFDGVDLHEPRPGGVEPEMMAEVPLSYSDAGRTLLPEVASAELDALFLDGVETVLPQVAPPPLETDHPDEVSPPGTPVFATRPPRPALAGPPTGPYVVDPANAVTALGSTTGASQPAISATPEADPAAWMVGDLASAEIAVPDAGTGSETETETETETSVPDTIAGSVTRVLGEPVSALVPAFLSSPPGTAEPARLDSTDAPTRLAVARPSVEPVIRPRAGTKWDNNFSGRP